MQWPICKNVYLGAAVAWEIICKIYTRNLRRGIPYLLKTFFYLLTLSAFNSRDIVAKIEWPLDLFLVRKSWVWSNNLARLEIFCTYIFIKWLLGTIEFLDSATEQRVQFPLCSRSGINFSSRAASWPPRYCGRIWYQVREIVVFFSGGSKT